MTEAWTRLGQNRIFWIKGNAAELQRALAAHSSYADRCQQLLSDWFEPRSLGLWGAWVITMSYHDNCQACMCADPTG